MMFCSWILLVSMYVVFSDGQPRTFVSGRFREFRVPSGFRGLPVPPVWPPTPAPTPAWPTPPPAWPSPAPHPPPAEVPPESLGFHEAQPGFEWSQQNQNAYTKCFPRYEWKYEKKCIDYKEKHCYTKHEEKCDSQSFQSCQIVPKKQHERKCENVVEKICHWRKQWKMVAVNSVQKKSECHQTTRRICDQVYKFDDQTIDEHLCETVPVPDCKDEFITVHEETCVDRVRYDCHFDKGTGYGSGFLQSLREEKRYGQWVKPPGWGAEPSNPPGPDPNWQDKCRVVPNKHCSKTPRTRKIEVCKQSSKRECKKVTNRVPRPVQDRVCKDEPYEECEIVDQPKEERIQLPVYDEDCKDVSKPLCDNVETTTLEVKCVTEDRPLCQYEEKPMECTETPKQYCLDVPYQVKTNDCKESYQENQWPVGPTKRPWAP